MPQETNTTEEVSRVFICGGSAMRAALLRGGRVVRWLLGPLVPGDARECTEMRYKIMQPVVYCVQGCCCTDTKQRSITLWTEREAAAAALAPRHPLSSKYLWRPAAAVDGRAVHRRCSFRARARRSGRWKRMICPCWICAARWNRLNRYPVAGYQPLPSQPQHRAAWSHCHCRSRAGERPELGVLPTQDQAEADDRLAAG